MPVCCQGLSDTADGSGAPDQRITTELRLSASTRSGTGQGIDPVPRENHFAKFRSDSKESSDGSMDTPLAFK